MWCADYEDIAELLGCRPTLSRLLRERPTALWHAYLTSWQPLHYRLVGPGRLENAEAQLEALYESRHYGTYKSSGRGYDALPEGLEGQDKPGDPRKLQGPFWWVGVAQSWWKMWRRLQVRRSMHQGRLLNPRNLVFYPFFTHFPPSFAHFQRLDARNPGSTARSPGENGKKSEKIVENRGN